MPCNNCLLAVTSARRECIVKNRILCLFLTFVALFFCAGLSTAALADSSRDRTQVGHDINIPPGEEVDDATCVGCSVRVRGHVSGDVTTFGGSIVVEDQGEIGGDATTFGGSVRLDPQVKVNGDVTVFGGRIRRDPSASIGGDVTNFGGPGWIVLIILVPFAALGGLIALIVWLIRRAARPSLPAAA
jgi:hypothetical protein